MSLKDELQKKGAIPGQKGSGRIEFLAIKSDIKEALESGYSVMQIWHLLYEQKKISIQYRMFKRYIDRYLIKTQQDSLTPKRSEPKKIDVKRPKHFEYNATPKSLDELV